MINNAVLVNMARVCPRNHWMHSCSAHFADDLAAWLVFCCIQVVRYMHHWGASGTETLISGSLPPRQILGHLQPRRGTLRIHRGEAARHRLSLRRNHCIFSAALDLTWLVTKWTRSAAPLSHLMVLIDATNLTRLCLSQLDPLILEKRLGGCGDFWLLIWILMMNLFGELLLVYYGGLVFFHYGIFFLVNSRLTVIILFRSTKLGSLLHLWSLEVAGDYDLLDDRCYNLWLLGRARC